MKLTVKNFKTNTMVYLILIPHFDHYDIVFGGYFLFFFNKNIKFQNENEVSLMVNPSDFKQVKK